MLNHGAFCNGNLTMLPSENHCALKLKIEIPTTVLRAKVGGNIPGEQEGAAEDYHAEVSIETSFWDPLMQAAKCLRCSQLLAGCECKYPNDLLLPVKKNECMFLPQPRYGAKGEEIATGNVGVMLRIPRTRTKPTAAQNAIGVKKSNAWLRNLPTCGQGVRLRQKIDVLQRCFPVPPCVSCCCTSTRTPCLPFLRWFFFSFPVFNRCR